MRRYLFPTTLAILATLIAPVSHLSARGPGGGRGGNGGNRGGNAAAASGAAPRESAGGGNFAGRNFSQGPASPHGVNGGANGNAAHANSNFFGANGAFANNRYAAGYRGVGPAGGFANNGFNRYGYGAYGLGYGAGGLGYGGYGLGGVGLLGMGMMMGGMMGGGGYGGGGGGYGGGYGAGASGAVGTPNNTIAAPNALTQNATPQTDANADYTAKGEADFKAANYQQAVTDWKHALLDEPQQAGGLALLMGQALFAQGQFELAAGVVQAGMNHLPESQWGGVVSNHAQLYGNNQDFTNQLKALENARTAQPDSPALRFLLGYEYGYLNYPQQAATELDKAIQLNSKDPYAATLRNEFGAKIGLASVAVPKPVEAPQGADAGNGIAPAISAGGQSQPANDGAAVKTTGINSSP
jgi:hypothetical protein